MPSAIAFSGNPLDRAAIRRRNADWVRAQWERPETRFLPFWRNDPLVRRGDDRRLAWTTNALLEAVGDETQPILLGLDGEVAHFALDVSEIDAEPEDALGVAGAASFEDLRAVAPHLVPDELGVAAQGRSLMQWHASNFWCPACGGGTRPRQGGATRVCGDCMAEHHPRTNPVAIAAVTDGERCLLGRSKGWPPAMYSALAGFVEPGETLEEALRREVMEEAGVEVGAVRYVKSQPWPFPSSLMMGCIAQAHTTKIEVDPIEIEDAAWFDRATVKAALEGNSRDLIVPPAMAIAHHLIREWAAS